VCESLDHTTNVQCKLEGKHKFHLADTPSGNDNYHATWVRIWKDVPWPPIQGQTHSSTS
jgi:hypothetical protein